MPRPVGALAFYVSTQPVPTLSVLQIAHHKGYRRVCSTRLEFAISQPVISRRKRDVEAGAGAIEAIEWVSGTQGDGLTAVVHQFQADAFGR